MERSTRQRRAVFASLAASGRALNAPEILELARRDAPGLNLSTVYRQVKALESDGEVVRVELPGQTARYEARCPQARPTPPANCAEQPHHHHHFHCVACDAVMPIHGCPGPMEELAPQGCRVERHDLVLHGRCADCIGSAA